VRERLAKIHREEQVGLLYGTSDQAGRRATG
jgi:hypothetical protein